MIITANKPGRLIVTAALIVILLAGIANAAGQEAGRVGPIPVSIKISFKLDPRLSGGTYGGEHWVSPSTYEGVSGQDTVETRVEILDAKGKPTNMKAEWIPSDPEMVTVSPAAGNQVSITVKRAGESKLKVAALGLSRELIIKAKKEGAAIRVEITQLAVVRDAGAAEAENAEALEGPDPNNNPQDAQKDKQAAQQSERTKELAEKNKKDGESFLTENAKKAGVVALPSGLQYSILREGAGKQPAKDGRVKVRYRATHINGTEFDNSSKHHNPTMFGLDRVIKGWAEALQLMKEGARWMIYVPSDLAYGERGAPKVKIGPNETLIFDVELVSVE